MANSALLAPPIKLRRGNLDQDRSRINTFLARLLAPPATAGRAKSPCRVSEAMEYAVLGDAQRLRPILTLRLARMLRVDNEHCLRAAAAVEILHSASLVVDDLPSMDNDATRRGQPAAHIKFGEATATLAAFSLVALAARIVVEVPASERDFARLRRFQLALLRTLDVGSLIAGQSMDLALAGEERSSMREKMNDLKTVPLFQLAVEAACVGLNDGVPANLAGFGRCFGLAFQLTDDLLDAEYADTAPNRELLYQEYDRCRSSLAPYGAAAEPIHEVIDSLEARASA